MKNLNPSNSKIRVRNFPVLEGNIDTLKESCISEIQKIISTGRKFVIGHTSEERARPRFKGCERHRGLDVNEIFLIFKCYSKTDAHRLEGFLIDSFWSHSYNRNKRKEKNFNEDNRNGEYFVYISCQ